MRGPRISHKHSHSHRHSKCLGSSALDAAARSHEWNRVSMLMRKCICVSHRDFMHDIIWWNTTAHSSGRDEINLEEREIEKKVWMCVCIRAVKTSLPRWLGRAPRCFPFSSPAAAPSLSKYRRRRLSPGNNRAAFFSLGSTIGFIGMFILRPEQISSTSRGAIKSRKK